MSKYEAPMKLVYPNGLCNDINKIIEAAIEHGGDEGGAYHSNGKKLWIVMNDFLKHYGLDKAGYAIVDVYGYGEDELRFAKLADVNGMEEDGTC